MNRTVTIFAVLLVSAMVASYFSWTHESVGEESKGVLLMDLAPKDLKSIAFKSPEFSITIQAKSDKFGDYYWAESTREIKAPKGKDGEPTGDDTQRSMSFKASSQIDGVLEEFAPFRAVRELENVADENLKEFGLEEPDTTLTLETSSGSRTFDLGKEGYGHRQYYLRDQQSKKIYLVSGQPIRSIRRGDNRLPERRLVDAELKDIVSVAVRSGDVNVKFAQQNAADRAKAFWSEPDKDEKNLAAEAWLEKLMRTRAVGYADTDVKVSSLESVATVLFKTNTQETLVEFFRGPKEGTVEPWFGKSAFTRGLVKLPPPIMNTLMPDVVTLIGLEPPPREEPEPLKAPASAPMLGDLKPPAGGMMEAIKNVRPAKVPDKSVAETPPSDTAPTPVVPVTKKPAKPPAQAPR